MEVNLPALAFCLCSWRSLLCPFTDALLPFRLLKRYFRHLSLDAHQPAVFRFTAYFVDPLCALIVWYGVSLHLVLVVSLKLWRNTTSLFIHICSVCLLCSHRGNKITSRSSDEGRTRARFQADFTNLNPLCYAAKTLWGVIWSSDSRRRRVSGMQCKTLRHMEELLA